MRSARRAATVTGLFFLGASVLTATPAYAGVRGDIRNDLPASYTVKIATFGGGSSSCRTWNAGTQRCTHWWLPSGKADEGTDGIRPGMDTDGFMVEQPVLVVLPTGVDVDENQRLRGRSLLGERGSALCDQQLIRRTSRPVTHQDGPGP